MGSMGGFCSGWLPATVMVAEPRFNVQRANNHCWRNKLSSDCERFPVTVWEALGTKFSCFHVSLMLTNDVILLCYMGSEHGWSEGLVAWVENCANARGAFGPIALEEGAFRLVTVQFKA